ncbi:MAG: hypothetical protein FVQ83_08855 [Chloroflexi bacterium]|nr:hypothetical protein [Chloroflexota bacterium]
MAKYLIEVPHENKKEACQRAVEVFLATGSHFMTNADWGCEDGEHKAWIMVELDDKGEAKNIVPPQFRDRAKIVELVKFTKADFEITVDHHHE